MSLRSANARLARRELEKRVKRGKDATRVFLNVIELARANVRSKGYALAVHGSLLRDVDLVAVPWVDEAKPPGEVHASLFKLLKAVYRNAYTHPKPEKKPQGRVAWVIHLGNGIYVDLSVITPKRKRA